MPEKKLQDMKMQDMKIQDMSLQYMTNIVWKYRVAKK